MRMILGLLLIILGLGWLASETPIGNDSLQLNCGTHWRRTVDGWERANWIVGDEVIRRPALHPTVIALLQMLLAIAALILFAGKSKQQPRSQPASAAEPHLVIRRPRQDPYQFLRARARRS